MRRFLISLLLVGILMLCLGVAAAQNYDDVEEFEVQSSVSAAEYIDDSHDAIIPPETFDKVQEIIRERSKSRKSSKKSNKKT